MRKEIIEHVLEKKVIAIVRRFEPDDCMRLAKALYAGGLDMMEIAFDQKHPDDFQKVADSIRAIREYFGDRMYIGAGTVMTREQVDMVAKAGAQYIISANMNPDIIRYTRELGLVSMPGALTPTEIAAAYEAGADFVKVFPAGNLGPSYIKALVSGPYPHIPLLAVGGISETNIREFLDAGALGAGIGGLLTKRELVEAGEFSKITELAKLLVARTR